MAGTPVKNGMRDCIAANGGDVAILDRIANGETVSAIARSIGYSRNLLAQHLNRDEQAKALLARARETGADAMAEQTIDLADSAQPTSANVTRLQIEQRKWFASKVLPDTYGEKNQATITVNVNTLHLEALKQLRNERIIDIGHATVQTSSEPAQLTDN